MGNHRREHWSKQMTTLHDLKQLPQWVGWKIVIRDDKKIKLPVNPHNGRAASTKDSTTWATADEAWQAKVKYKLRGVGFVFTLDCGVVGVDLDDCFDGWHLKDEAKQVVQCLNSYTEFSPSGNGLHILAQGEIPNSIKRNGRGFEMYNQLRYFTVTGNEFGKGDIDEPSYNISSDIEARQAELMALWVTFGDGFQDELPAAVRKTYSDLNTEKIRHALTFIPAQLDYDDWLKILMAVHSEYPDSTGIELIESWSPGFSGVVEQKFRSFNRGNVTKGTMFYYSRQYGYTLTPSGDIL
jgi:hypothetical protein